MALPYSDTNVNRYFKQISRRPDLPILLVWLFTIPAILPFAQPVLLRSADGLLHLYRVVALSQAVLQGAIFPRWLPDLAYGYGFPLFVFYAPLSYYITWTLSSLGLNLVAAFNLSFGLALLLAGTGAYLFVKTLLGPKAGLLAGAAYVYAPFQLLNTLSRGGLPAAWAMALFPFVFWIFARLMRSKKVYFFTPLSLPLAALILGVALLTHNTLTLLFVPLLGLYLAVELLVRWRRQSGFNIRSATLQVGFTLFLGFGLAAFFLLPAILEKEFAQVQRVIISPDFDFRFHFVTLKELFSLPQPAYTGLLNPQFPLSLGLPQAVLALIGWISTAIFLLKAKQKNFPGSQSPSLLISFIFTTTTLVGAVFMMLPVSIWIWEQIPLLAFVQFPHRLLGPLALVLAALAGTGVAVLTNRIGFILTIAGITLIFLASIPFLYPRYQPPSPEPTLLDMMAYEHTSGAIGTTSFGEYLPVWVEQIPAGSPLESLYQAGGPIERLDPTSLPPTAIIESAGYGFNQADVIINSPEPYRAIYQAFYFPGWTASIDGQPAVVTQATPTGLISVDMPAGRHRLKISFQETTLRKTANAISVVSLGVVVGLIIVNVKRKMWIVKEPGTSHIPHPTSGFKPVQLLILAGLAAFFIAAKLIYLDNFDSPFKQTFDGAEVAWANESSQINFGDQITLLGYTFDTPVVESGKSLNLTAFWQARYLLTTDYSALAQLVDDERNWYSGQDNLHPGALRTSQWQPDGFVQDKHSVPVHAGTPDGDYFLVIGLYNSQTGGRLPIFTESEISWGDVIAIPVTVTSPARPPTIAELGIAQPVQTDFGPELRFLGYTREQETVRRNDFLRVALFWEAMSTPTTNYRVSLRLLDSGGDVVAQETSQPSFNRYPTGQWAAGERVRDNHAMWVPPDFPAGTYHMQIQVLDEQEASISGWADLGAISTAE